jgi:hypothetical protein
MSIAGESIDEEGLSKPNKCWGFKAWLKQYSIYLARAKP